MVIKPPSIYNGTYNLIEIMGSYCFIVGHCSGERVGNHAEVSEGTRLCDKQYGRKAWTTDFGAESVNYHTRPWIFENQEFGFNNSWWAHIMAKAACAVGSYHCDRLYCHDYYCHDEYFKKRYGCYVNREPEADRICSGPTQ